jgi:hypothetical protein
MVNERLISYSKEFNEFKTINLLIEKIITGVESKISTLVKFSEKPWKSDISKITMTENKIYIYLKNKMFIEIYCSSVVFDLEGIKK